MHKHLPKATLYGYREVFYMNECIMCGRRGDVRSLHRCGFCGQLLCDDCAERNSGLCDDCASNERYDEW